MSPRSGVTALLTTGAEMHLEATVRLNAMAFRLEELIADRWFSVRQASPANSDHRYCCRFRPAHGLTEMHQQNTPCAVNLEKIAILQYVLVEDSFNEG